jgi:hypothetical protein
MVPYPEQHVPQAPDARRVQNFLLVGLTAILLVSLAFTVIAFRDTQAGSAAPQATSIGPAVYGWLPAPQAPAIVGVSDASRIGPVVYGWLPNSTDASHIGPAVYGWLPNSTDASRIGPAVYGWLPDSPANVSSGD